MAAPLLVRIEAATASAWSPSMSATTTLARSLAKSRASASPIPCAPPVTIATLPSRRIRPSRVPALYWRRQLLEGRPQERCLDDRRTVRRRDLYRAIADGGFGAFGQAAARRDPD